MITPPRYSSGTGRFKSWEANSLEAGQGFAGSNLGTVGEQKAEGQHTRGSGPERGNSTDQKKIVAQDFLADFSQIERC